MKSLIFMVAVVVLASVATFFYLKPSPPLFWGYALEGFPITQQQLNELNNETNHNPEIILFYLQWPSTNQPAEKMHSSLDAIWEAKALPCITWEPMFIKNQAEQAISYQEILDGKYDQYIISFANEIREWQKPLIVRFAHEMNLSRYHWGTSQEEFGSNSPEIYVKMFRYVVGLFKQHDVHNVLWAFCPNSDSVPNEPWNSMENYYPGDNYVDILGMDGYNWDNKEVPWRSFEQIFQPLFKELEKLAPNKPIIVFETSTNKKNRKAWIKDALSISRKWGLNGIIWFHANKEQDWRLLAEDADLLETPRIPAQEWAFHLLAK